MSLNRVPPSELNRNMIHAFQLDLSFNIISFILFLYLFVFVATCLANFSREGNLLSLSLPFYIVNLQNFVVLIRHHDTLSDLYFVDMPFSYLYAQKLSVQGTRVQQSEESDVSGC